MDIYCPRCGEPWETDYVYHEMTTSERAELLAGRGCSRECRNRQACDSTEAVISQAALEVCGDDLDGAAAMLEDFGC